MPWWAAHRGAILAAIAFVAATLRASNGAEAPQMPGRPVTVRVTWGGGKPRAWSGSIRLICADEGAGPAGELEWRTLSTDADAAATVHAAGSALLVHEPAPRGVNGVEIVVPFWRASRVAARLFPDGDEREAVTFEMPVADVVLEPGQRPLGKDGNRLTVRAAPGEGLRVSSVVTQAGGTTSPSATVFRPGDTIRMAVEPLLPRRASGSIPVELRVRLSAAGETSAIVGESFLLSPCPPAAVESEAEQRLQEYETVRFDLPLPSREGVYDVELTAVETGGLRWSRPLSVRTIQVATVAVARPDQANAADGGGWKLVYELDPGSPRLHERLRRLPAVGRAYVPLPAAPLPSALLPNVPMPNVSLPSVAMPNVPMPSMPIPKLPGVALPSVADMVPRLGGLLAAGHSSVEPHPLGTMLKLPPARTVDEPSWEGIVVVGAQPGQPHIVEVEFPTDQRAAIGLVVLEPDASGTTVEVRGASGFEVRPSDPVGVSPPPSVGRHAFAFWPTTRHPLIVVANPSCRGTAIFGRVRVTTGPLQPAPLDTRSRGVTDDPGGGPSGPHRGRTVHAFVPSPDLTAFGGTKRTVPGSGRCIADWQTFLAGVGNATAWFAAQGASGSMWVVHRDGAALWPSRSTRAAPRWDPGVTSDAGLDPGRKDLLELLCRVHDREGLRLIPAVSFDAPLPALESILATGGPLAAGIACVGRDGRPRPTAGGRGCHYNLLDPRVQQAVEDVVRELAGRLRTSRCVDGIALLVPHDGWMHMPGTAWGLDDATFARFLADVGEREPAAGGDRFARRAALVEGPLRDRWLEWRTARVARFHARLADVLAEHEPRWSLHVAPTTLLTEGPLAARFRPTLGAERPGADIWREIAIDPAMITADPRIVLVTPQVHAAGDILIERSAVDQANGSLEVARGVAGASRRGLVTLEKPSVLSVAQAVAHGPFSGAAPACDAVPIPTLATGVERNRPLADAFVPADVEIFFDMGLLYGRYDEARRDCLRAFVALPPSPLMLVDDAAGGPAGERMAPLVLRTGSDGGSAIVSLVNAGPLPCRGLVSVSGNVVAMTDRVGEERIPVDADSVVAVSLAPWQVRTLACEGDGGPRGLRAEFPDSLRNAIDARLADLRRRRAVLETPRPLDVLDNPGFELAGPAATAGRSPTGGTGGWELVEASRGACALVPGVDAAMAPAGGGRALAFSSHNGLSTLRSNPFPAPQSGRVSVAVWLRIAEGDPQPPLRVALEGMHDGREYYRFAAVGGLVGGRPLTSSWSQFVLQIDDLPSQGLESLRVRFDLLGPGAVQLDGVRVFDLAFDEPQRVQLSRHLAVVEERLAASDLGACLVALDGHWPRFLAEFVSDEAVASLEQPKPAAAGGDGPGRPAVPPTGERTGGILDQVRRWWQ